MAMRADFEYSDNSKILVVDDDRVMNLKLVQKIEDLGYETLSAKNGREACAIITERYEEIETILLDREMPEMNGMAVVDWMRQDVRLTRIPVIMQTGADSAGDIKSGIDAGVFYYLTKPIQDELLISVLEAALRRSQQQRTLRDEMSRHRTSFTLIDTCEFHYKTLEEARDLAVFIANLFPDPERAISGLGELMANAVEHGHLEIGYEEKSWLIEKGKLEEERAYRLSLPQNISKKVLVSFKRSEKAVTLSIQDEGSGFNWHPFMNVDPARALDNHGRGIAIANSRSFDTLSYNEAGNKVTVAMDLEDPLEW